MAEAITGMARARIRGTRGAATVRAIMVDEGGGGRCFLMTIALGITISEWFGDGRTDANGSKWLSLSFSIEVCLELCMISFFLGDIMLGTGPLFGLGG